MPAESFWVGSASYHRLFRLAIADLLHESSLKSGKVVGQKRKLVFTHITISLVLPNPTCNKFDLVFITDKLADMEGDVSEIKLGDASCAAPFTWRLPSYVCRLPDSSM